MYQGLLHTHVLLRYFILIMLIVVIVMAAVGFIKNKPYGKLDNKFSLYLFIFTHLQLTIGLILYFVSPFVKFNSETMKDPTSRYWTVEHVTGMLIAVALITVARISSKKLNQDVAKHKRMLILNSIALVIILTIISLSGRPIL